MERVSWRGSGTLWVALQTSPLFVSGVLPRQVSVTDLHLPVGSAAFGGEQPSYQRQFRSHLGKLLLHCARIERSLLIVISGGRRRDEHAGKNTGQRTDDTYAGNHHEESRDAPSERYRVSIAISH